MLFLWLWMGMAFANECQWDAPKFYAAQPGRQIIITGQGDLLSQDTQFSFNDPIDILTGEYEIKARQGSFDVISQKAVVGDLELRAPKFVIYSQKAVVVVSANRGQFKQVRYLQKKANRLIDAKAKKVDWNGQQLILSHATYSECPRNQRSWEIYAKTIHIDHKTHMVQFTSPGLRLYGRDLGSISSTLGMSMNGQGSSGWLFPTWQINSRLGFGVGLPYYIWASNTMDLELTPVLYTKPSFGLNGRLRWMDGLFYWESHLYAYPFDSIQSMRGRYAYSLGVKSHPKASFYLDAQLSHVSDKDWTRDFSEIDRDNQFFIPSYLKVSQSSPATQWQFLFRKYQFLDNSEGQKMYAFDRLPDAKIHHQFSDQWSATMRGGLFSPVGIFPNRIKGGARFRGGINYHQPGEVDLTLSANALAFLEDQVHPKQIIVPSLKAHWADHQQYVDLNWVSFHDQTGFPLYIDTHQVDDFLKPVLLDDRITDHSDVTFGVTSQWHDFDIDLASRFAFQKHRICIDPECEVDWLASHHMIPLIVTIYQKKESEISLISELVNESPYMNQLRLGYHTQTPLVNFALNYDWHARYYSLVQEKMISGASLLSADLRMDLDQGWHLDLTPKYMYDGRNKIGYVVKLYHQDCCSKFGVNITLKPQIYDQSLGFNHRPELSFSYELGA